MNPAGWMRETFYYANPGGVDAGGDLSYGAAVAARGKVEHRQQRILNAERQEIQSDHQIATLTAMSNQARIWLPGQSTGDQTLARVPQRIDQTTDRYTGRALYTVFL